MSNIHFSELPSDTIEQIVALMDECGLIPSVVVTPSLLNLIHSELNLSASKMDDYLKQEQMEFLDFFVKRRRSRSLSKFESEQLFIEPQLELFDGNDAI